MDPAVRQRALRLLALSRPSDFPVCRETEAACHAAASCGREYLDRVRRAAYHLAHYPGLGVEVAVATDAALARGTEVERREEERRQRASRFSAMLQEKYEALNDRTFAAIVRCRRCGSEEVVWEEKQTRSADEGATVFCSCVRCKLRWVMR